MIEHPSQAVLEVQGITKRFPGGVVANDDVSLTCRTGEVHAILGQNGAGKSTLMKVLAGHFAPDAGVIRLRGAPVRFGSPKESMRAGIGIVHQHFSLVDELTVAENLFLNDPELGIRFRPRAIYPQIHAAAARAGTHVDPSARVGNLSEAEKQRVEILKVILLGADILILDEPTSMLAPQEADALFDHVRQFVRSGGLVLLVTHKVQHVFAVATHITVLRGGKVAANGAVSEFDADRLILLMAGRDGDVVTDVQGRQQSSQDRTLGETVLSVRKLCVPARSGRCGLKEVNIRLRRHEILGVAGLAGNGQDDLIEAIFSWKGNRERVQLESTKRTIPRIGIVPGNRALHGLASSLSVEDNLLMRRYAGAPFQRFGFLSQATRRRFADQEIERFSIQPKKRSASLQVLSGGNRQKVLLARELDFDPDLLVAVYPTAGLDFGATQFTFEAIRETARKGCAVLVVSEDLDELLALCDQIVVLYQGQIVGSFPADPSQYQCIGLAMNGMAGAATVQSREGEPSK